MCCVCALPTLSQVLSNRGCAQEGALQPLEEEEGGGVFYGEIEEQPPTKKRRIQKKEKMTDPVF